METLQRASLLGRRAFEGCHAVQFFETDAYLCEEVSGFLQAGLETGESLLLIATPARRESIAERLSARGVDVTAVAAEERITMLDADGTLSEFMLGGTPDWERFKLVVGASLGRSSAKARSGRVRAYGEMVDVLWRAGKVDAAIRLEEMWNELGALYPINLLCAYVIGNFPDERAFHAGGLVSVAARGALAAERARLYEAEKGARTEAERLVAELSETVRLNDLFTGVLAHDLRNPLGAILSAAELASRQSGAAHDEAAVRKLCTRILGSGHRMSRMIDQLLDFTRIRLGTSMRLEPRPLDLRELVRRVSEELQSSHADVRFKVDATGDTNGCWDEDRLCQVLSNLVANAVQHGTLEDGIEITLDGSDPTTLRTAVHNGGAIPTERLPKLFAPLEEKASRKQGGSGLGLGLFIAHELARAHGGSLEACSSPAAGTTFTLVLPRVTESGPLREQRTPLLTDAPLKHDRDAWKRYVELGETGEKFRLLVESVEDYAIFMLDPEGRVATWNAGAARIKGYSAREIIGQHSSRFYEESDVASGLCRHELAVAASEGRSEAEGFRVRKDGSKFWAHTVITALRDEHGALTGFAKVTRDLTERRRLEEERIRRAQAEEALRLRDEFVSTASHELRTPLAVLELQLDALEAQVPRLEPALAKTLARARRGTGRLALLVDSLLEATRIANETFTLAPERFDLAADVAETLDGIRPAAALAGCELDVELAGPLVGDWDRRRVRQLVTNLAWNALTYAAGAPVRVSVRRDGTDAVIEVSDHGPGIADGDIERIFERFERACSTSEYGGLGLGLYIVREIARMHGGSVAVDSAPDRGARFIARLPAGTPAPEIPCR